MFIHVEDFLKLEASLLLGNILSCASKLDNINETSDFHVRFRNFFPLGISSHCFWCIVQNEFAAYLICY